MLQDNKLPDNTKKLVELMRAKDYAGMQKLLKEDMGTILVLPSQHQIEDEVVLNFGSSGSVINCEVIKVHFSASKVLYDIEVRGTHQQTKDHPAGTWTTRLYNVDSVFVTKPQL